MLVRLVLTSGKREGVEIGMGQVEVLLDLAGSYRVLTL